MSYNNLIAYYKEGTMFTPGNKGNNIQNEQVLSESQRTEEYDFSDVPKVSPIIESKYIPQEEYVPEEKCSGYTTIGAPVRIVTGEKEVGRYNYGYNQTTEISKYAITADMVVEGAVEEPATVDEVRLYLKVMASGRDAARKLEGAVGHEKNFLCRLVKEAEDFQKYNYVITNVEECRDHLERGKKIVKTPLYKGNLFFNTPRHNNHVEMNLDVRNSDSDINKWADARWVFTNIDPKQKTLHYMTRMNRPGLIPFKEPRQEVFDALKIDRGAKGIFIVVESCTARPEFCDVGTSNSKSKRNDEIAGVSLKPNSLSNRPTYEGKAIDPMDLSVLRPNAREEYNAFESYYRGDLIRLSKGLEIRRSEPALGQFIGTRREKTIPFNAVYDNLFDNGVSANHIKNALKRPGSHTIRRWMDIVESNYNNPNIVLLDPSESGVEHQHKYKKLLREYTAETSNTVFRFPKSEDERELISATINCPGLANPDRHGTGPINGKEMLLRDEAVSYKDQLNINPNMDIYVRETKMQIQNELDGVIQNYDDKLEFANIISFQDVIFIPYSLLENNGGEYYDNLFDYYFVDNDIRPSRNAVHPYSPYGGCGIQQVGEPIMARMEQPVQTPAQDRMELNLDQVNSSLQADNTTRRECWLPDDSPLEAPAAGITGASVKVISTRGYKTGAVLYTKMFNTIQTIPVVPGNTSVDNVVIVTKVDPITRYVQEDQYPLTRATLKMLGLTDDIREAQDGIYNPARLERDKLSLERDKLLYGFEELSSKREERDVKRRYLEEDRAYEKSNKIEDRQDKRLERMENRYDKQVDRNYKLMDRKLDRIDRTIDLYNDQTRMQYGLYEKSMNNALTTSEKRLSAAKDMLEFNMDTINMEYAREANKAKLEEAKYKAGSSVFGSAVNVATTVVGLMAFL